VIHFTLLLCTAVLACGVKSASATMRIIDDQGGQVGKYLQAFAKVRSTGERVIVDGDCLSACTMVLGMVPRNRVCATQNAVLGFHAAWMYDESGNRVASPSGTRGLLKNYPPAVRAWIARNGGLKPDMMYLRGGALAAIIPPCNSASRSTAASNIRRVGAIRHALGE